MNRLPSGLAYRLCLCAGVAVVLAGFTVRIVGSRNTADIVMIAGMGLILAALAIQRRSAVPTAIIWAHPSLQWAYTLPLGACLLVVLVTIGYDSTALKLTGLALAAVSAAVLVANQAVVRRRRRSNDRG